MRRILLLGTLLAAASPAASQSSIQFEPYNIRSFDGQDHPAELGLLWVPALRGAAALQPAGRDSTGWIHLAFVRLRSTAATPGSPIVFLMGGPGIAATTIARVPVYWQLFDALRAAGDVILLDQRGLGRSTPTVDCPPPAGPPATDLLSSNAAFTAGYRAMVAECAAYWRARHVDPRAYSVAAIAADVDELRRGLGVPRVNLLGFSYGTHLALAIVSRYPATVDRVALAGTDGPEDPVRLPASFDLVFRTIAAAGRDSAPPDIDRDLEGALRRALDTLDRQPAQARIRTRAGDSLTLTLTRQSLQMIVSGRLGDARMPAMVTAAARGDYSLLGRFAEATYNDIQGGGGSLMARAVTCSSPGSAERQALARRQAAASLFGEPVENDVVSSAFCSALGGSVTPEPATAVRSDRPALFITGTLDDRTPPAQAEAVLRGFPHGLHLLVRNGGHETLPAAAVQRTVVEFFQGQDVRGRELAVAPPRFLSILEAGPPREAPARRFAAAEFASLRWLEGAWRGSENGANAFYERYVVLDDSTIGMRSYRDSAFTTVVDSAIMLLRGGQVTYRGGGEYVATAFDGTRIRFEPRAGARNAFEWRRQPDGTWMAVIETRIPNGAVVRTTYRMERPAR